MPNKNIIVVLIICLAIIVSVWIFQKSFKSPSVSNNQNTLSVDSVENITPEDAVKESWQNILSNVSTTTTEVLAQNNSPEPEEITTLTDQVAKDILSQYLVLKQNNGAVTSDEASQIAMNALNYQGTQLIGIQYTIKDILISNLYDIKTSQTYSDSLQKITIKWPIKNDGSDLAILKKAVEAGDQNILLGLDKNISMYRGTIVDLLKTTVPADAVQIHLELLNACSNMLADTEALRQTFEDPAKSFIAIKQYQQHAEDIWNAVKKIGVYLEAKGI